MRRICAVFLTVFVCFLGYAQDSVEAVAKNCYKGIPVYKKDTADILLLANMGYSVGFSKDKKIPLWAAYRLPWVDKYENFPRPRKFRTDERLTKEHIFLTHDSYAQSDYKTNDNAYDRGHMAPNFAIMSRYGDKAQTETFLVSNICPQRKGLNEQTWQALEEVVADKFSREFGAVWVTVGPLVKDDAPRLVSSKTTNEVGPAIPYAFYMIILDEKREADGNVHRYVLSVIMDQGVKGTQRLGKFVKTVSAIEKKSDFVFFPDLKDNERKEVEDEEADESWGLEKVLK